MTHRILSRHVLPDGTVTKEFAALMVVLSEGKPAARLTESGIKVYALALGDLTGEQVAEAVWRAIRELPGSYLPSPADLLKLVVAPPDERAVLAWVALQQAAEDHGAWVDVEVGDGAAAQALEAVFGGWGAFCAMPDGPGLGACRQAFLVAYRDARRAHAAPRTLPGLLTSAATGKCSVPAVAVLGAAQGGQALAQAVSR